MTGGWCPVERRLGILLVLMLAGCRDDASHAPDEGSGTSGDPSGTSTGGTAADTSGGDESSTGSDTDGPPQVVPAPGGLRRLRSDQYLGSIEVLLGGTARDAASPPPDQASLGFDSVGGATFPLSPSAV